jgi:hypothetical protein
MRREFYRCGAGDSIIPRLETVCPERVRLAEAGTPKAQIPPGNAQAQERQTAEAVIRSAGLLESGGS